jgi:hypothetical protein
LADLRVSGWSGGFIAFSSFGSVSSDVGGGKVDETIGVSSSPDGFHWTAGKPLDIAGVDYWLAVAKVVEGPAGLLAIGMPGRAVCGGPTSVTSLWTSTDGNSWIKVDFAAQFGTATVWTVDAGSTGDVATGDLSDGTTQVVWLSDDGRSWQRVPLPTATFGTVEVQGGTAFAGGYVLSGAVRGDEGCGGPNYVTPSLWWSADGKAWSRVKLSGATPGTDAWMSVTRISDHSLLAVQTSYDSTTQVNSTAGWVSTDGRTWSPTSAYAAELPGNLYSNGQRSMTLIAPPSEGSEMPVVATVDDDLTVTELSQSGDVPTDLGNIGWAAALGPSGLLVVSLDGNNAWLGMPTTR